jgi:predicted O-methyltransferase YrrM
MEQELPTWFNHVKPNFENYLTLTSPLNVLQIGAYKGDTTQWLLDNKDINRIVDVDTWEGSMEHEGTFNFNQVERVYDERFKDVAKVEKRKGTSDKYFATRLEGETFNVIYIDGDHTALQTAIDSLNAWRILDIGGIMIFDDYDWHMYQGTPLHPKDGIECALRLFRGRYTPIITNYQVWIRKTAE